MNNIFAMPTIKRSNQYTSYALDSFFKNTILDDNDEFFLIDNDGCELDNYSSHKKIKILKNTKPKNIAQNINQIIDKSIDRKKNLIFLNNDIIFTKNWLDSFQSNSKEVLIPVNNQIFQYQSDCKNLKLTATMNLKDFNDNYILLDKIAEDHKKKFQFHQKAQGLLMPFFCFKIPYEILSSVGHFDDNFDHGGEDVDYRIRCIQKGYEVNFLLDSYLLHFHGKSSWDGGETKEETKDRDQSYTKVFLKKWGEDMTKIFILRKEFSHVLDKHKIHEIFKQGKFDQVIKKLTS